MASREVLPRVTAAFVGLTLVAASAQTIGRRWRPPFDVVDLFGARLVDVAAGEWWRLLSAGFVSLAGWPHALLNAIGALLVIRPVERRFGRKAAAMTAAASAAAAFSAGVWGHGVQWLCAGGSGAVLGCAGFLVVRWKESRAEGRWGAALVTLSTFGGPILLTAVGQSPRGSVPAHAGAFAVGVIVATVLRKGVRCSILGGATVVAAVASLSPLAVPLRPGAPDLIGCRSSTRSTEHGAPTRLLFLNPSGRDVGVRSLSPAGRPGDLFAFSPERRDRMPWYGYAGAVYEVVDSAGTCVLRAVATHRTSTVVIPPPPPGL